MEPLSPITILSLVAGILSILMTGVVSARARHAEKAKLREAEEASFKRALKSDDLATLGHYINDVIGKFNISEYAGNPEVSNKVDSYIDAIIQFVKTDTEVDRESEETEHPAIDHEHVTPPDELKKIIIELRSGEAWSALARLRRHLEVSLRRIARMEDMPERPAASIRYILELLLSREVISKATYEDLRYSIAICNRAIHGLDISSDQAQDAVLHASKALKVLAAVQDTSQSSAKHLGATPSDKKAPVVAKFELYKDTEGEFRWRLLASNGQVIATGGGYKTKESAKNGIESMRKNAPLASVEEK